jgi:hypothetical protein
MLQVNNWRRKNMSNLQQPSMGGFPERNELVVQPVEVGYPVLTGVKEQTQLASLMEAGFMWEEAVKLLNMRENICENEEMHQRMGEDYRMHFARWLVEHGEISES